MGFSDNEINKLRDDVVYYFTEITKQTFYISGDRDNKSYTQLITHMKNVLDLTVDKLPGDRACIRFFHEKQLTFKPNTLIRFNDYVNACKDILKEKILKDEKAANKDLIGIKNSKIVYNGAFSIDEYFLKKVYQSNRSFFADQFYLAQQDNHCQWYGIIYGDGKGWDVLRECYPSVKNILLSTDNYKTTFIVIHGEQGCGKSTLLRRLSVDLISENVTILWLTNIKLFEENLTFIQIDFNCRYVLFIDGWDKHVQGTKDQGEFFLTQLSVPNNLTVVISDNSIKNKSYSRYLQDDHIFYLSSDENVLLLEKLADKNPGWKKNIENIILNAEFIINPIYVILFVLTQKHANESVFGKERFKSFLPEFRNIIKNDLEQINSINFGAAMTLYYLSCVYKNYRIIFSWKGFAGVTNGFNHSYFKKVKKITEFDSSSLLCKMLSKYIYLDELVVSSNPKTYACYFHHDLLPEEGLSYGTPRFQRYSHDSAVQLYDNLKESDLKLSNDLYKIICLEDLGYVDQMEKDTTQYFSFDVNFNELLKTYYSDAENNSDEDRWHYNLLWIIFYLFERNPKELYPIVNNIVNKGCNAKCVIKLRELCENKEFISNPRKVLLGFTKEIFERASNYNVPPVIFQDYLNELRSLKQRPNSNWKLFNKAQ